MRIEQLRFQAFGPYVEEQVIDFSQFQDQLFLIRGETGAGKTAILDAITYAIYGNSSGGERGELQDMRCRLAKAEELTFVECIICIRSRRYRFYRQVEVHKKRNNEVTFRLKVDAGELLEDGYHPFFENCKQRMIEEKAQQLIGLSHAQFIQVMMLPQGKFEQLLISSSEAKQEILKSLFQVDKWADICDILVDKAKLEKDALEQTRSQIHLILQQSKIDSLEDFDALLQVIKQQYTKEETIMKEVHKQYQEIVKQLQEQTQYQALQKQYQASSDELKTLELQKKDMDILAKRLAVYKQFIQIKPYFDALKQSEQRLMDRKKQIQVVSKQIEKLGSEQEILQQAQIRLEPKKHELEKMKLEYPLFVKEYEQFAQRVQLETQCKNLLLDMEKEQMQQVDLQHKYQSNKDAQTTLFEENRTLEKAIQAYPEILNQEQTYANALVNHEQCIVLHMQKNNHEVSLSQLDVQLIKCKEQETLRDSEHEVMYQNFLDHSADLLAQSLIEGNPCPVCGARDHPSCAHAQIEADVVGSLRECKEALTKAKERTQAIHEKIQIENSQLNVINKQITGLTQQLSALLPQGYDKATHEQLQQACVLGKTNMQVRMNNLQKIDQYTHNLQLLEQRIIEKQETCQTLQQKITILQTKLEERTIGSTFQDGAQLYDFIQTQKTAIATYEQEIALHIQKTEDNQRAKAVVLTSLAAAKMECEKEQSLYEKANAQYKKQQLDNPQEIVEEMDEEKEEAILKHYEQRCVEVKSALKQLASQLENKEFIDLLILQKQVDEAQVAYQETSKVVATLESQMQMLQTNAKTVRKLQKQWELALGAYEQLNSFVKAMRGDNSIGIERYVLGVMLSQITQVANQLLENVHSGRYQIYRSDDTSGRVRKFGLELSIYDTYSCSQRSVISLSGGEKFLVSLALSLALSTVVQARSGGIYLETMFVDEGFGSLDEQSIADALQVLSCMGKQKAMIGIISHVELLKENIPYGIQVKKQRMGSSLRMLR